MKKIEPSAGEAVEELRRAKTAPEDQALEEEIIPKETIKSK